MQRNASSLPPDHRRLWLATLVWMCTALAARAAPTRFDLETQPAATALMAFAKQANVEVLFSFRELNTVQSPGVAGTYEPEQAIALLLRGTGFHALRTGPGKFVVVSDNSSQAGAIRGSVVTRERGAPIAGASVRVANSSAAATTNHEGEFMLDDVPVEARALIVRADGFTPVRVLGIAVRAREEVELEPVRLASVDDPGQLDEIIVDVSALNGGLPLFELEKMVVTPSHFAVVEERGLIAAILTESDLLALPQFGEDLYRSISHLPGLAADDLTARFWVRGAPHEDVLARLDGVDLLEPFHLKDTSGSLSILDIDTISRLNLYTGGFTAEFGDRMAAVLTMETDSHVRAKPRTTIGVSLTGARFASRGQTPNGRNRWLVSARVGYPDLALEADGVNRSGDMRPRYHDLMGKWERQLTPDHVLSVHALHAGDAMYFKDASGPVLRSRYASDYVWGRWRGDFGRISSEAVLSAKRLASRRTGTGLVDHMFPVAVRDERELTVFGLRQDVTAELSDRALLRGGFEVSAGSADYDYFGKLEWLAVRDGELVSSERGRSAELHPAGQAFGGYLTLRSQPCSMLTLETGARYDGNDYQDDADVSPRLGAALRRGRTTFRAAWGFYDQSHGLHELAVEDGETSFSRAQRAEHRVLSVEHRFESGVNVRLEGYERRVRRPRVHWENVVDSFSALPGMGGDRMRLDPTSMRARGIELIVERRINRTFFWSASFAAARAEETLRDGTTIPRMRDQRHTVYIDAAYTPNPRWQFSAVAQFHTGWPISELRYQLTPLNDGSEALTSELAGLYNLRLPDYYRLDFRVQRRFELRRGTLRLYLDIFNVLNRRNVVDFSYRVDAPAGRGLVVTRSAGDELFPVLPSLGAVWEF